MQIMVSWHGNSGSLETKFKGGPLAQGLKLGWGGFPVRDAISRKWCEIGKGVDYQKDTEMK